MTPTAVMETKIAPSQAPPSMTSRSHVAPAKRALLRPWQLCRHCKQLFGVLSVSKRGNVLIDLYRPWGSPCKGSYTPLLLDFQGGWGL